jgi:hypothetical protein
MPKLTTALLQQEIDYVVLNDDIQGAFECYNLVKNWLATNEIAKTSPQEYGRYFDYLIKLKFLSLNYFDDINDYYDLLKNYFPLAQDINNFDLWEKLEVHLVAMQNLTDRDAFKAKMREALEKSDSLLINRQKYKNAEVLYKVSDWVKDFITNLGLDSFDKLKKMEYITNGSSTKLLDEEDRNKVKALLDIYEKLHLSSKTPEGYENSVAMNIDGKEIIFNQGEIDEVSTSVIKNMMAANEASVTTTPVAASLAPSVKSIPPTAPTATAAPPASVSQSELEQALKDYSPSSLEYKALKQEINRLKVAEFKQAQKSTVQPNVKK